MDQLAITAFLFSLKERFQLQNYFLHDQTNLYTFRINSQQNSKENLIKSDFTHRKFLIQLVGEQRVWELSKIQLTEGAHGMDVLNIRFFRQVGDMFRVKFMANKDERNKTILLKKKQIYDLKQKAELMFYSNDCILCKLHLDFSSNWVSGHKTNVFLNGNYGHSSNIKMDNDL